MAKLSRLYHGCKVQITVNRVEPPMEGDPVIGGLTPSFRVSVDVGESGRMPFAFIGIPQWPQWDELNTHLWTMIDAAKECKNIETAVRADWFEEQGFPEAAAKLRTFDD